jgi:hypothetical protein
METDVHWPVVGQVERTCGRRRTLQTRHLAAPWRPKRRHLGGWRRAKNQNEQTGQTGGEGIEQQSAYSTLDMTKSERGVDFPYHLGRFMLLLFPLGRLTSDGLHRRLIQDLKRSPQFFTSQRVLRAGFPVPPKWSVYLGTAHICIISDWARGD